MILYLVRLGWLGAGMIALMAVGSLPDQAQRQIRFWALSLGLSLLAGIVWWPELGLGKEYEDTLKALGLVVLAGRTLAALEALQRQTEDFPFWSRMMAGSFVGAGTMIGLLTLVRDGSWGGLALEYRRYLQIWTALTMGIVELQLGTLGWLRRRWEDYHAGMVGLLVLNHALVSLDGLVRHLKGAAWASMAWVSTAIDGVILLAWALRAGFGTLPLGPEGRTERGGGGRSPRGGSGS